MLTTKEWRLVEALEALAEEIRILKGVQELPRLNGTGAKVTKYDVQGTARINRSVIARLLNEVTDEIL